MTRRSLASLPDTSLISILSWLDFTSVTNALAVFPELQAVSLGYPLPCWTNVKVTLNRERLVPFWHFLNRVAKYVKTLQLRAPTITKPVAVDVHLQRMPQLTSVDLMSCQNFINDMLFIRLVDAAPNMQTARLAGCNQLSRNAMNMINARWARNKLRSIDLSGCVGFTGIPFEPGLLFERFIWSSKPYKRAASMNTLQRRKPEIAKGPLVKRIIDRCSDNLKSIVIFSHHKNEPLSGPISSEEVLENIGRCSKLESIVIPAMPPSTFAVLPGFVNLNHLHIDFLAMALEDLELGELLRNASFRLRQLRIDSPAPDRWNFLIGIATALAERHADTLEVLGMPILRRMPDSPLLARLTSLKAAAFDVDGHYMENSLSFLDRLLPAMMPHLALLLIQVRSFLPDFYPYVHSRFTAFRAHFPSVLALTVTLSGDYCQHAAAGQRSFCLICRELVNEYRSGVDFNCCLLHPSHNFGPWPTSNWW